MFVKCLFSYDFHNLSFTERLKGDLNNDISQYLLNGIVSIELLTDNNNSKPYTFTVKILIYFSTIICLNAGPQYY